MWHLLGLRLSGHCSNCVGCNAAAFFLIPPRIDLGIVRNCALGFVMSKHVKEILKAEVQLT